jgi:hypothetical protein
VTLVPSALVGAIAIEAVASEVYCGFRRFAVALELREAALALREAALALCELGTLNVKMTLPFARGAALGVGAA